MSERSYVGRAGLVSWRNLHSMPGQVERYGMIYKRLLVLLRLSDSEPSLSAGSSKRVILRTMPSEMHHLQIVSAVILG